MKKIGKALSALLLVCGLGLFLFSCKTTEEPPVVPTPEQQYLNSIELNTGNVKKEYYLGEEFSSTNLVVTANFSDGTSNDVSSSAEVDASYFNKDVIGKYPIFVSYTFEGRVRTREFTVEVKTILAELTEKYIVGIDVEKDKIEYFVNEEVGVDDLHVSLVYSDDTKVELTSDKYTTNAKDVDIKTPTLKPLFVEYSETYTLNGVSQTVVVKNFVYIMHLDPLISIEFVSGKTEFDYSATFDTSDWKILAKYESGASKEITDFTCSKANMLSSGNQKVVVTYVENGVKKTVDVQITVGENQFADYELNVSMYAVNLKVKNDVEITSNHKQELSADELDSFFTTEGKILKYLTNAHDSVRSIELCEDNSSKIKFTVEGIVTLRLNASSNGGSNCSLLKVTSEDGTLQKQTTALPETSTGLISLKGSSDLVVTFVLNPGTYIIEGVAGTDDSTNAGGVLTATRAVRLTMITIKTE